MPRSAAAKRRPRLRSGGEVLQGRDLVQETQRIKRILQPSAATPPLKWTTVVGRAVVAIFRFSGPSQSVARVPLRDSHEEVQDDRRT